MSAGSNNARHHSATANHARVAWLIPPLLVLVVGQLVLMATSTAPALGGLVAGHSTAAHLAWLALQLGGLCGMLMLVWRFTLVARYRPVASVSDAELPSVTVIVPAYNEGKQVFETLRSLVQSDYPMDRLEIIAVDDGSVDDTWSWIERGRAQFSSQVVAVRCRVNRGKRSALYEGFSRARGDVIVTVDSDSEVLPDTIRNMVSPFVVDPRVGAVAGNVRVLNHHDTLGRMLDVAFTYAFEFVRASESMVDTVTCCPGALSAFRRGIIDQVKHEWLHQTFFGKPANIGEDRALTNLVLQLGYLVKFQSNAIVLTEVPKTFQQLSRMYLRWDRSDVREVLLLARFIFTRFRPESAWGARLNFAWWLWQWFLQVFLFVPLLVAAVLHPATLGWVGASVLLAGVLPAAVFATNRGSLRGLWAFPYAVFATTLLSWITPYAFLTAHRSGWLTRVKTAPAPMPTVVHLKDLEVGALAEANQNLAA